jgi:hypothetical protein
MSPRSQALFVSVLENDVLWEQVFINLEKEDRAAFRLVCHKWRKAHDDYIMRNLQRDSLRAFRRWIQSSFS